ncbi:hypothetical protein GCM10009678_81290 [Actinomadura kijaniata]
MRVAELVRRTARGTGRFLAAHGLFLAALAGAVALRWIAILGFPWIFWFGDSRTYLNAAIQFAPDDLRPSGYSVFLWALRPFESWTVVLAVQHALGALTGVMVYAIVWRGLRAGRPRWRPWAPGLVATPVTLPVLYDAYQIQLEHMLMSDGLFTFLLTAGVTLVLWRRRVSWWAAAPAGLALGAAAMVRSVGLPLIAVVLFCMLLRRAGWRALVSVVAGVAVPLLLYLHWFHGTWGVHTFTKSDQIWMYGRVVDFARCDVIKPRPELEVFCMDHVPPRPRVPARAYQAMWTSDTPFRHFPEDKRSVRANELAGEFVKEAIAKQPGDYLNVVVRDTLRAFEWKREDYPTPWTVAQYDFPVGASQSDMQRLYLDWYTNGRPVIHRVVEPQGAWMRDYQHTFYLRGPFLGIYMLVGLAGVLLRVRRLGGPVLLPWGIALALLVVPAATADFDYRYLLPCIPFAVLAAGLTLAREPRAVAHAPARSGPEAAGEPEAADAPETFDDPEAPDEPETSEGPEAAEESEHEGQRA